MASWSSSWRVRYRILISFWAFCVIGLAGAAWAQAGAAGAALPALPGVEDEGAPSSAPLPPPPAASPAAAARPRLVAQADDTAAASTPAATPAAAPGKPRFASVDEARDRIREAFAARNYTSVVSIAADIRKQFPEETFMRYYETTALLHLHESPSDIQKLPYRPMDSLPQSNATPFPSPTVTPAVPLAGSATAAVATPAVPASAATPAATPRPVRTAPVAPAQQRGGMLSDLMDMVQDNPALAYGGGGGVLFVLVLAIFIFLRRRRASAEDELEEKLSKGKSKAAPPQAEAEAPKPAPRPAGTTSVFRREPAPSLGAGAPRSASAPPAAAPARPAVRQPAPAVLPIEEPVFDPLSVDPVFSLVDDAVPSAPAPAEKRPAPAFSAPAPVQGDREDNLALFENMIAFDESMFDRPAAQPAPVLPPAPVAPPPRAAQPAPPAVSEKIAESLFGNDNDSLPSFAFPLAGDLTGSSPVRAADDSSVHAEDLLTVVPEMEKEDLLTVSDIQPPQGELSDGWQKREQEPEFSDDEIALAGEATQTAFGQTSLRGDMTLDSHFMTEATEERKPEEPKSEETQVFQSFRPGETVTVRFKPDPEAAPAPVPRPARVVDGGEHTVVSAPAPEVKAAPEVKKAAPADPTADVFEREYNQGVKDAETRNWVGAIHHLSIAAALRPGALDVKDRLREARRLRAKELEGRG